MYLYKTIMRKNTLKISVDIIMLIGFVFLLEPLSTGLYLHEWAGLFICVFFILHQLINWIWIKSTTQSIIRSMPNRIRVKYIVDLFLLLGFTLVVFSGIKIAHFIDFSWLGLSGSSVFWKSAHISFSMLTLIIVGIHLGLNWSWVRHTITKSKK